MADTPVKGKDLVLTQAEQAPPPHATSSASRDAAHPGTEAPDQDGDPALLEDVRELARRAGGLERLRDLVDLLIRRG